MGIGMGPVQVAQKRDVTVIPPPAPPFAVNSADNGLSVNTAGAGEIVLGNDVADPAMPAQLLSDRDIVSNGFTIHIPDFTPASIETRISDQRIEIQELTNFGFVEMHLTGATSQITANSQTPGGDAVLGLSNLQSSLVAQTNGVQPFIELSNPTETYQALLVLGVLRIRSASGTGNGLNLDSVGNDAASTGTLSTADPGGGIGKVKFGQVLAGAVVPDATRYMEIENNGVVYKVIVAT